MESKYTYKIEDAAGVGAFIAVVRGAAAAGVAKPAAANAGNFVGITLEAQATQNKDVPVQSFGIGYAKLGGEVSYGDALGIGGSDGTLVSVQTEYAAGAKLAAGMLHIVGFAEEGGVANDVIKVNIAPFSTYVAQA